MKMPKNAMLIMKMPKITVLKMLTSAVLATVMTFFLAAASLASGGAVMIIPSGAYAPAARSASALPEDATVLLTLEGTSQGSLGTLRVYTRPSADMPWELQLSTTASYGSLGLYKTAEGDMRTPAGIFKMNTPFGIKAPLEGFPADYISINESHYWVGDQSSPLYNKLVSTDYYSDFDPAVSEHLIDYAGYYDYCLDTGYNMAGTPGAGSAIFLHCTPDGSPTHGCIAIPESDMIRILCLYEKEGTYIAVYDAADPLAVYTP